MNYPSVIRNRIDPQISKQSFFIFSFIPSKNASPDKDGCFGVTKFRGAFSNMSGPDSVDEKCDSLIRNYDSVNTNKIMITGRDYLLTGDPSYFKTHSETEVKTKLSSLAREYIKGQRAQEQKDMDEIQKRERLLLDDVKHQDVPDTLDSYLTLRNKRASLRIYQESAQQKLKTSIKVLKETIKSVEKLEKDNPDFKERYKERYMKALEDANNNNNGECKNESTLSMIKQLK
jgi:hypothetical protein